MAKTGGKMNENTSKESSYEVELEKVYKERINYIATRLNKLFEKLDEIPQDFCLQGALYSFLVGNVLEVGCKILNIQQDIVSRELFLTCLNEHLKEYNLVIRDNAVNKYQEMEKEKTVYIPDNTLIQ